MDTFFRFAVTHKLPIIRVWIVGYFLLLGFLLFGARSIVLNDSYAPLVYDIGRWCGRAALSFFIVTIIPGMTKRFGIQNKGLALLRIFRRYFGISVFLLALTHSTIVRWAYVLTGILTFPQPLFVWLGISALTLLFFMFLTSNDWSVRRLGIWWYRIHWATYIIMWLVFFHTAIQRWSIWSIALGITVVLQMTSLIYDWTRKKPS